jgi:nucleotide-binding universal stress UspA family protein
VVGLGRSPGGLGAHVLKFDEAKRRMLSKLQEARQQRTQGYPKCELIIDIGNPYEKLLAITTERKVDLIVISTHGLSGLQHLVMGSVAEKLIRHAPCPVFVVRRGAA